MRCDAVTVIVVDSSELFRSGISRLLRRPNHTVIASGHRLDEAVFERYISLRPRIFIFGSSTEAEANDQLMSIKNTSFITRPRLVLLTDVIQPDFINRALAVGVDAVVSRKISSEVLRRSLDIVMMDYRIFPTFSANAEPAVEEIKAIEPPNHVCPSNQTDMAELASTGKLFEPLELASVNSLNQISLSEREYQISGCLAQGYSNKMIARKLLIMEATVKTHIKSLLRKLRADNRTQIATWAIANQISFKDQPAPRPQLEISNLAEQRLSAWRLSEIP